MSKNYKNNSKWVVHATYFEADLFTQGFLSEHTILAAVIVGCPSNGRRVSLVSDLPAPAAQTSAVGTACSRLPWPAVLPRRPHRPLLFPRWPGPAVTAASHRSRTSEPSYSSPHGLPLPRLPRLHVVPFLGLAVVHRHGALGAAWSTWSRNNFHRKSTVHGEADSWVHGYILVFL